MDKDVFNPGVLLGVFFATMNLQWKITDRMQQDTPWMIGEISTAGRSMDISSSCCKMRHRVTNLSLR